MVLEPCNAARISPAASFHVLRHTYASHLVMAGGAIAVAAANLGHSDTRMTEKHYAHLAPNYVADVIRATMPRLGLVEPNSVLSFGLPSGSSSSAALSTPANPPRKGSSRSSTRSRRSAKLARPTFAARGLGVGQNPL